MIYFTHFCIDRIQSLHGNSEIATINGDIALGTLEGNVCAITQNGDINVYLASPNNVRLSSDTGVILKL